MRITPEQLTKNIRNNFYDFMNERIYQQLNQDFFVLERRTCELKNKKWETTEYLVEQLIAANWYGYVRFDQNPDSPSNNRVYITFKGLWFVKTYLARQCLNP